MERPISGKCQLLNFHTSLARHYIKKQDILRLPDKNDNRAADKAAYGQN